MTAYAKVDRDDDTLLEVRGIPDPDGFTGPPAPPPTDDRFDYHLVDRLNFWQGQPSPTHVRKWNSGAPIWVESVTPAQALMSAIAGIDAAADAARTAAIGDPARALEYQRAELQARAYATAGYTGIVPRCVKAWATPKNWSGQQAADDIIATAEVWYEALDTIRDLRLAAKEAARNIAADPEGTAGAIYAVQRTFLATLHNLMQALA